MRLTSALLLACFASTAFAQPPKSPKWVAGGSRTIGLTVPYSWDETEPDEWVWPSYPVAAQPQAGGTPVYFGGDPAIGYSPRPTSPRRPATVVLPQPIRPTPTAAESIGRPAAPPSGIGPLAPSAVYARATTQVTLPAAQAPAVVAGTVGGKSRAVAAAPQPGNEVMVFARPGTDGAALGGRFGLATRRLNADSPDVWILRAADPAAAVAARSRLAADPQVTGAYSLFPGAKASPRAFTPNDPFFFPGANPPVGGPGTTTDAFFPGQWHLVNNMPANSGTGPSANDPAVSARVAGAWANDFTGTGITIGIVEDAVQVSHPDLQPNNSPVSGLNRYYSSNGTLVSNDPSPPGGNIVGDHGTAVAGVAAARGGNGIGVTGSAPLANLVGIRVGDLAGNDSIYFIPAVVAAYGLANGTGPTAIHVKNHSYGPSAPYLPGFQPVSAAIQASALAGTVNVIAIGNDRGFANEDGNKAYPQNSPHAIMVGALGSNGTFNDKSSFGANMMVTAPSNTYTNGFGGITTADRTAADGYNASGTGNFANRDYTNGFGDTSSAAPLVAGVVALTLQANPGLLVGNAGTGQTTTRAVKHLLARTSTVIDPGDTTATSDGGWRQNSAGFRFNQNYGFGLVNAATLTQQAPQFTGVTPLTTFTVPNTAVGALLPDGGDASGNNPGAFVSRAFTVTVPPANVQPLEEVLVTLSVTTTFNGDLEGFLQSPSGYRSRLMYRSNQDGSDNLNWTFATNAFWGEQSNGDWQLDLRDVFALDRATWNSYSVEFRMGALVPVPEPAGLVLAGGLGLLVWRRRVCRRPGC